MQPADCHSSLLKAAAYHDHSALLGPSGTGVPQRCDLLLFWRPRADLSGTAAGRIQRPYFNCHIRNRFACSRIRSSEQTALT